MAADPGPSRWAEFDCTNCGMHIICMGQLEPPAERVCAHCQWFPGWIDDPRLGRIIDPDNWRRPPVQRVDEPDQRYPNNPDTFGQNRQRQSHNTNTFCVAEAACQQGKPCGDPYRDDRYEERACDRCGTPYRGPAVCCWLYCAAADARAVPAGTATG